VEGVLHVSPCPRFNHQRAAAELGCQLDRQLPAELCVLPAAEVVLFEAFPVTVRVPDLVVVPTELVRRKAARCSAADVALVIEVVSPGSVRTDNVTKLDEYAKAGIEQYWIVDLDDPATVTVYRLIDDDYRHFDETTETLQVRTPVPLTLDVTALTP
jgi:Uma2 family endonuclease